MNFLRQLFCQHNYFKQELTESKKEGDNNLVISSTFYNCSKCHKCFEVIEDIKVERDFYLQED